MRPCYDLSATEKWANRRKNARLVDASYDWSQRSWVIARGKSVAAKTQTPGLRPGYDLHAIEKCRNRGQI